MHIGFEIKERFFSAQRDGEPVSRQELLDWSERDRLGVVLNRPYGAIDAALLIMLAQTAFYDLSPKRRRRPLYPDVFAFHYAGHWGNYIQLDIVPDHKEIFVPADPRELLRAINNVGITHLVIPDVDPVPIKHRYKEPEAALDRLKKVFTYQLRDEARFDAEITVADLTPFIETLEGVLNPERVLEKAQGMLASAATTSSSGGLRTMDKEELEIVVEILTARVCEVPGDDPHRVELRRRLNEAIALNRLSQRFGIIEVEDALERFHCGF